MEASQIIREIVSEFRQVVEPELRRTRPPGSTEYTTQILTGLCRVGQRFGLLRLRGQSDRRTPGRPGMALRHDVVGIGRRGTYEVEFPLVAECEWGSQGLSEDDLQKLLVARATLRVMVYNQERKLAHRPAGVVGGLSGRARRHLPVDRLCRRRWGLSVRVRGSPRCGAGSPTKIIKVVIAEGYFRLNYSLRKLPMAAK